MTADTSFFPTHAVPPPFRDSPRAFRTQDLAVKMEGNFILRYRCFDLFSKVSTDEGETPVWAQCYGGQFRVYSTKEFPGLRASTDLTKVRLVLSRVRLTSRLNAVSVPTLHSLSLSAPRPGSDIHAGAHAHFLRLLPLLRVYHAPFLFGQHLSYFGVRLNLRETERKRRKKVDDPTALAAAANKGKGKRRDEGDGGEGGYRQYDD